MTVFSFIAGADCAGISGRLAEAIPGFRSMVSTLNYIDYPGDLDWDRETAIRLWNESDQIYSHHGFRSIRWAMRKLRVKQKPFLIHYHGASTFNARERIRHVKELRMWTGAKGAVSTLDLQRTSGLPWLPAPYNVDWLESYAAARKPGKIRIAHAPTNRALKSTDELLSAGQSLIDEGYPVEVDVIENVTWKECLRRKAGADIYFDQVVLGYGCNALEAWGMGIPVVAGADEATLQHMQDTIGYLPFAVAEPDSILKTLRSLCDSDLERKRYQVLGMKYLRHWHDYPAVASRWDQIWL